ncbi:transcription elongation factor SPT5 [Nematocida homosporus]|uniref:transcription elongation factor SPT5 n=1 Tax=Nematocida homosporus TaxID=1912981 RepID=UPI00221FA82B|nr:transcription elongation factor SPT5 [Nematocida homosporus]KAI5187002.1 transcription elongation factor SPT5 [Nematocida homosporus]
MSKRKRIDSDSEDGQYKSNKFVDVEASESDDEDEGLSDFINEIAEEAESESLIADTEESGEEAEPVEAAESESEGSEEPFEEYTKKIERRYSAAEARLETEEVPQQMLLPTDKHPRLWLIRCLPKKEKSLVLTIMRKVVNSETTDSPINITGVLFNESAPGYIYVEAYQKQQVLQAIEGVTGAFRTTIVQVPAKEMADALIVSETDPIVYKPGSLQWLTKGRYAGDLVQVEGPGQERGMVAVRIVPRLGAQNKQALFSPEDYHPSEVYKVAKNSYVYKKETYTDGYLLKDVPTAHLVQTPTPTTEERSWFSEGSVKEPVRVAKGEFVEVIQGALKGASGIVISTGSDEVLIKIGERKVALSLFEVRKRYAVGDEVIVVSGRKRGKSGFILGLNGDHVRIAIDGFSEEIEVHSDEIKLGSVPTERVAPAKSLIRERRDPLLNRSGSIIAGEHKGKRGIVKDVQGSTLRIQLIANLKYVTVPRDYFEQQKRSGPTRTPHHPERRFHEGNTTPIHEGNTTPVSHPIDSTPHEYPDFS